MQTAQQKNDLTSLSELTTLPSFYVFSQTGENHTHSTRGPRRRHVFTSLVVFSPVSLYLFRPCSYRRSFSNAPGSPAFHRLPQYLQRHSDCVEPLNNTIRNQSRWENKRHRMTVCPCFLAQVHVRLRIFGQNDILHLILAKRPRSDQNDILIWIVNFRLNIPKSLWQIFGC